jgi:hypothetical protein
MRAEEWRWDRCGGCGQIWESWCTTCLIGLERPRISVVTPLIWTHTCHNRDGKLTCAQSSLKSQFRMMNSPIFSHLSLFRPQLHHHLKTWSWVNPLHVTMPWSIVNIEYSIHLVQCTPRTAYINYSIHQLQHTLSTTYIVYSIISWSTLFHSQPVPHLLAVHAVLNSLHSHNYMLTNAYIPSSCRTSLLNHHLLGDHLHILLQSRSILAS